LPICNSRIAEYITAITTHEGRNMQYHSINGSEGEGWNLVVKPYLEFVNFKSKSVVDLGAAEGGLSLIACELGAAKVLAIEYMDATYQHLKSNAIGKPIIPVQADLNTKEMRNTIAGYDIAIVLNIHHHLTNAVALMNHICKNSATVITNYFDIPADKSKSGGRVKLCKATIMQIMYDNGLNIDDLGTYREGRFIVIGRK
jgi:predicted RNA methylase